MHAKQKAVLNGKLKERTVLAPEVWVLVIHFPLRLARLDGLAPCNCSEVVGPHSERGAPSVPDLQGSDDGTLHVMPRPHRPPEPRDRMSKGLHPHRPQLPS